MDYILIYVFHFCFSTFIGGYFLWSACQMYGEWSPPRQRRRTLPAALPSALKTTDAGPYTAPGVPTEPEVESKSVASKLEADPRPSYLAACGINFLIYWTTSVACLALGWQLALLAKGSNADYVPNIFWLGPLTGFCIAWVYHAFFLQTTHAGAFWITMMLTVPWGASWIALWGICLAAPLLPR